MPKMERPASGGPKVRALTRYVVVLRKRGWRPTSARDNSGFKTTNVNATSLVSARRVATTANPDYAVKSVKSVSYIRHV